VTWRLPLVFVCSLVYLASGIRVGPRGDSPPLDIDEAHKLSESYDVVDLEVGHEAHRLPVLVAGILRTAAQHNQANVGVYASVRRGGTIRRGDPVLE
jgi:hypothetical protein